MKIRVIIIITVFISSFFLYVPGVAAQSPDCTDTSYSYPFNTGLLPFYNTNYGWNGLARPSGDWFWVNGQVRFDYVGRSNAFAELRLDILDYKIDSGIPLNENVYVNEISVSFWHLSGLKNYWVIVVLEDGSEFIVPTPVSGGAFSFSSYSSLSPVDFLIISSGWTSGFNHHNIMDSISIVRVCPTPTPAPTVSIPTRTPTSPPTPTPTLTSTPAGTCLIGTTDYRTAAVDNQSIEMGTGAGVLPVFQSNLNSIVNGNYRILFDVIPQSTLLLPAGITVEYYDENPQQWVLLGDYFINNRTGSVNGSLGWGILLPVNRPISAIRFKSLNYPGDNSPVVIDRIYVEGVDCTIQLPTPYAGTPVRSPNTPTAATPVPPNPPTPTQTACSSGGPCSYWTPIPPPLNPTITSTPCVINGGCPIIPKPSSTTTPRTNPFPTNIPTPLRTTIPNPSTSTPPNNPNPNPNPSTSTPPNNPNPNPKTSTSTPPPNNPPAGFGGTPSWSAPSAVVAPAPVKWIYAATPDFRKVYTIEQPILISATVPLTISGSGIVTTTLYMSGTLITLNGFMGTVADYNSYIRTEISGTLGTVTIVRQVAPANYAPSLPRSLANIGYTFENMDTSKKYSLLSWSQFFGEIIAALFNFIRTLYQLATHLGPLGLMLKWLFAMLVLNGAIWTFYFLFRVLLTLIKLVVRLIEIIGGYAPTGG